MQTTKTRAIVVDEAVFEQLRQLARLHNLEVNEYATQFISRNILRENERATRTAESVLETKDLSAPFDADRFYQRYAEKHHLPDLAHLAHLSDEERENEAEQVKAQMEPEVRAAMEREGLL